MVARLTAVSGSKVETNSQIRNGKQETRKQKFALLQLKTFKIMLIPGEIYPGLPVVLSSPSIAKRLLVYHVPISDIVVKNIKLFPEKIKITCIAQCLLFTYQNIIILMCLVY